MKEAYVLDDDIFNAGAVRNARAVDDNLRELAPVVKLSRENITMIARYEHVSAGLRDWKSIGDGTIESKLTVIGELGLPSTRIVRSIY